MINKFDQIFWLIMIIVLGFILILGVITANNRITINEKKIQEMRQTIESLEKEFTLWRSRAFYDEKYINEHVKGVKK